MNDFIKIKMILFLLVEVYLSKEKNFVQFTVRPASAARPSPVLLDQIRGIHNTSRDWSKTILFTLHIA